MKGKTIPLSTQYNNNTCSQCRDKPTIFMYSSEWRGGSNSSRPGSRQRLNCPEKMPGTNYPEHILRKGNPEANACYSTDFPYILKDFRLSQWQLRMLISPEIQCSVEMFGLAQFFLTVIKVREISSKQRPSITDPFSCPIKQCIDLISRHSLVI